MFLIANGLQIGYVRRNENVALRRALRHFNGINGTIDLASLHAARTVGYRVAQISIRSEAMLFQV